MEAMATLALMLAWLGAVKAYPGESILQSRVFIAMGTRKSCLAARRMPCLAEQSSKVMRVLQYRSRGGRLVADTILLYEPQRLPRPSVFKAVLQCVHHRYLTCDRSLEVGSEIMFNAAVQADGHGVTLAGLDCGGSYSPGDQISVDVTPPGGSFQYILEVSGAVLTHDEANCGGTRLVNQGSATLDTSASTGEISIWTAKGIGPSGQMQPGGWGRGGEFDSLE
eukprot:4707182-Pleurochrysis_carterae.AAC.1